MKLPRDLSGEDLARALVSFGYQVTRQTGSHARLTTALRGEHHLTVPLHAALKAGTLAAILREVASHHGISAEDVARQLFG